MLHRSMTTKLSLSIYRESNPWFTSELMELRAACRKAERRWRRTHSSVWKVTCNFQYKLYRSAIARAKQQHYSNVVTNAVDSKNLWKTVNNLLHRSPAPT